VAEGVEGISSSKSAFDFGAAAFLFFDTTTFGSGLDFFFFANVGGLRPPKVLKNVI
jgi:hypothetical protein